MTSGKKRAAGGFTILEGVWLIYALTTKFLPPCPSVGCFAPNTTPLYSELLIILALALVVDGLIGVWGTWFAFPVGVLLSVILLATMGYSFWQGLGNSNLGIANQNMVIASVIAAVGVVSNAIAMRAKNQLSEQANPMNLPVFG